MTQLTTQFHVPADYHAACDRLTTLVQKHAHRLLADEYWSDEHLDAIHDHSGHSYTYIRDDDRDHFEDVEEYVYSRFKRCVYHRVTHVLDAHVDEYEAFQFIIDTVEERKIRRIGWQRIRTHLFDDKNAPYIPWSAIEECVEKVNRYYDRHGRFPAEYTELVGCPEPNGTLPYAPDKGDHHIHDVELDDGDVVVTVTGPDSLSPESHHDWTEHTIRFPTHDRFHAMLNSGDGVGAPTLHHEDHGYVIDLPVEIPELDAGGESGRVLAVDLGVSKQATAVPIQQSEDGKHEQVGPPIFIDHHAKDKLFRVRADAEGVNDRLAALRQQGKDHTDRFAHLLAEYRRTRRRERRLRRQIQHDVANHLVWHTLIHDCTEIVFESLGELDGSDHSGKTAWSISSWARGELLDRVEYRAELVGVDVQTVNPWGTSRYCPRCGERGRTVKAPTDHTECRHGGHFHCPHCEYECDRDVVGAVNVGRKHLSGVRMETANPADYTSAGNHASFPPHSTEACARSAADAGSGTASASGVQSPTDEQEEASGRQTHVSQCRVPPLTVKRDGTQQGGLHRNHSRKTGQRKPSGSILRYVLASTSDSTRMVPNPAEN